MPSKLRWQTTTSCRMRSICTRKYFRSRARPSGNCNQCSLIRTHFSFAADFAAKEKWVRINEHWLQFPLGLARERKYFRVQIERILHDVVVCQRSFDGIIPIALVQLRAEMNAVTAVIVVRFQN